MSGYENELVDLTPIIWSNKPLLWLKNIVTLPGTLLCPGAQIDNTFKLKKCSSR